MSRRRGRPTRLYRLSVRTERRDPFDYAALAQAALEQAAMDRADEQVADSSSSSSPSLLVDRGKHRSVTPKESRRGRLA